MPLQPASRITESIKRELVNLFPFFFFIPFFSLRGDAAHRRLYVLFSHDLSPPPESDIKMSGVKFRRDQFSHRAAFFALDGMIVVKNNRLISTRWMPRAGEVCCFRLQL
jgi:hypothetical protein